MKKFISIIIIITTVFSLSVGIFLYRPQKAQAIFGIGDISVDPVQFIKENILDGLVKPIARHMVIRLQQEIARWAQGGFTDENKPFAMTSWKQEVAGALQIASSKLVQKIGLTPLCAPIRVSINTLFNVNVPMGGRVPYESYAACTLQNVIDNVEDFYKNPSISVYGWDSWTELTRPNNNFLGSLLMALDEKERMEDEEITEIEKEIEAGGGVKNETTCKETDIELCTKNCNEKFPNPIDTMPWNDCMDQCEKTSTGICIESTTKKLGSEIKASVQKAIGSEMDWLISADEITEMINLVFSGLFNKLTRGINGLFVGASSSTSTISKNQAEYAYYRSYKKTQTPQEKSKLRSDILANILNSIKNAATSGYACDKDEQLNGEVYQEIAVDILNEESQHLYTTMEGVNLKPDFEVLDTQIAVDRGIAVYGTTWDEIPFNKYPQKCADIANKKCSSIITGLPYELNIANINAECTTGCLETINNYRIKGMSDTDAINTAVSDGECSSYNIGNACLQGAYLIDTTETYCFDCVKKYQESCALKTLEEQKLCLELACGEYENISSSITSAQDFYNRCALNQTKYSCNVCLKEYFMPADYCLETFDFINRAFVKYPALVYENTWYGMQNSGFDKNKCVGSTYNGIIPTGLTCRILPDFNFGGVTCKTLCSVTDDELKNIADNEPSDLDCIGPQKSAQFPDWGGVWFSGGKHPGLLYMTYTSVKRVKCCPAFSGHKTEEYMMCRGTGTEATGPVPTCSYAVPVEQEPWCYCNEGERPLGWVKIKPWPEYNLFDPATSYCRDFEFSSPNKQVRIYTDSTPGGGIVYIAQGSCNDPDENLILIDANNDGEPDDDHIASDPGGTICSFTTPITSGMQEYYCNLGQSGDLHAGVYNSNPTGISTTMHVCAPCSGDSDAPYYGTEFDQCNNKIK